MPLKRTELSSKSKYSNLDFEAQKCPKSFLSISTQFFKFREAIANKNSTEAIALNFASRSKNAIAKNLFEDGNKFVLFLAIFALKIKSIFGDFYFS